MLATGGFMGSDPALTADKLAELVADQAGALRPRPGRRLGGRGFGGGTSTTSVSGWIQANCQAVDPSLYGGTTGGRGFGGFGGFGGGNNQLYDCAAPTQ